MKPATLFIVFLLGLASAGAQTIQDEVAAREKKRLAEVAVATDHVNKTYLKDYEALLQRANLVGDAQGANLVRAVIRRLNPEPEPAADKKSATSAAAATDSAAVLTANHWINEFTAQNNRHRAFDRVFRPDGETTSSIHGQAGTWQIVNNELVVRLDAYPDAIERYLLPVRLEKWRGIDKDGVPHFLSVDKTVSNGGAPTSSASPAGSPAASPAKSADYFGKPVP